MQEGGTHQRCGLRMHRDPQAILTGSQVPLGGSRGPPQARVHWHLGADLVLTPITCDPVLGVWGKVT